MHTPVRGKPRLQRASTRATPRQATATRRAPRYTASQPRRHVSTPSNSPIADISAINLEKGTIPLNKLTPEYLLEHPEIAIRAHFARTPSREEVTGLTKDDIRDNVKVQLSGNKKLNTEKMITPRDTDALELEGPREARSTLRLAISQSQNKLSDSILGLALVEPAPKEMNRDLAAAELNLGRELTRAPEWNLSDEQLKQQDITSMQTIRHSEHVFRGDQSLKPYLAHAKKQNLTYFEPTGDAQLDQLNKANLEKGLLPMPNFSRDLPEISPKDISQIDALAQQMMDQVKVNVTARQPYDTASMIIKERLKDLGTDPQDFFAQAGCPTVESRTIKAYSRYLHTVAVKGTVSQALSIWREIKRRGLPLNAALYNEMIGCLALDNMTNNDAEVMLKEMMLNKPQLEKTSTYLHAPEWCSDIQVLPKSARTPRGAPDGFISCAPTIATYGGVSHYRTKFNPSVEFAFYLFEKAKESSLVPTRALFTQLMKVCGHHQQYERAFVLFEEFNRYAQGEVVDEKQPVKQSELALAQPHREAKLKGYEPDTVMATTLMSAAFHSYQHKLVEETFHRFWESGLQPDAPMYNLMIRSCTSENQVEKAFKYFEQLGHFGLDPSIVTYTSLIRACVSPERPEFYPRAFEVFHECVSAGFRPNGPLMMSLVTACAAQADIHNLLSIYRLMVQTMPHLLNSKIYTQILSGLATSMNNDRLPGYGGYVLTRTGRTLYGAVLSGDPQQNEMTTSEPKTKLTREDRLAIADNLYAEAVLRTQNQDRSGTKGGNQFAIDAKLLDKLVSVYAEAAAGILRWDRHERDEGREDPLVRLTPTHVDQLLQRTWDKVTTLQQAHPNIFKLTADTYKSIFTMYGAADRMDDAVYHVMYLLRGLKQNIPQTTWKLLLRWCKTNAHHGPALLLMDEMREAGYNVPTEYNSFFQQKDRQMDQPIEVSSYPQVKPSEELKDEQFQNRYDKKGRRIAHSMDYDVSYKDF